MVNFEKVAKRVFQLLKGHNYDLKVYSKVGKETPVPEEGRFFFVKEPNMMVIISPETGTITLNKSKESPLEDYNDLIQQLRYLTGNYMLRFATRSLGKVIQPKDFSYHAKKQEKTDKMSNINESTMYGSNRTSYQMVEDVKIIVKHRKPIDENVRGARSRHIHSIFLEKDNNRYEMPVKSLSGARALARHASKGGSYDDSVANYILENSKNLLKLVEFVKYTKRNKLVNEDTSSTIELVKENAEAISHTLKQFSGYKSYDLAVARISESSESMITEEESAALQDMFTVKHFDSSQGEVLPIISKMVAERQNYLSYIQEMSENVIFISPDKNVLEDTVQYTSDKSKFGNKLVSLSSRVLGSDELSKYVRKIGDKLIAEQDLSAFEQGIVENVLSNVTVKTEDQKSSAGLVTEALQSIDFKLGKYGRFLLKEDETNIPSDAEIFAQLKELGMRLKSIQQDVKSVKEDIATGADLRKEFGQAVFRFEAAKKGLGIANKLRNPEDKKKHLSRVMSNINVLRNMVNRLEKEVGKSQELKMPTDDQTVKGVNYNKKRVLITCANLESLTRLKEELYKKHIEFMVYNRQKNEILVKLGDTSIGDIQELLGDGSDYTLGEIRESLEEGVNNNPDYLYYVLRDTKRGIKIDSGWEYKEDAKERIADMEVPGKAYHKSKLGAIDPSDDNWWTNASDLENSVTEDTDCADQNVNKIEDTFYVTINGNRAEVSTSEIKKYIEGAQDAIYAHLDDLSVYPLSANNPKEKQIIDCLVKEFEKDNVTEEVQEGPIVLGDLSASSKVSMGKSKTPHRAVLIKSTKTDEPVIQVEQCINGKWYGTPGRWFLSTLTERGISDSIWIDHGQEWGIDAGMRAAIKKAQEIVNGNQTVTESIVLKEKTLEDVLSIVAQLTGVPQESIYPGSNVTVNGYPATIEDNTESNHIDFVAVDSDAAKGIKGALMTAGLNTVRIDKATNTVMVSFGSLQEGFSLDQLLQDLEDAKEDLKMAQESGESKDIVRDLRVEVEDAQERVDEYRASQQPSEINESESEELFTVQTWKNDKVSKKLECSADVITRKLLGYYSNDATPIIDGLHKARTQKDGWQIINGDAIMVIRLAQPTEIDEGGNYTISIDEDTNTIKQTSNYTVRLSNGNDEEMTGSELLDKIKHNPDSVHEYLEKCNEAAPDKDSDMTLQRLISRVECANEDYITARRDGEDEYVLRELANKLADANENLENYESRVYG